MKQQIESSTVIHTPHGDLELPSPPIEVDVQATYKSNLSPLWLVFETYIFNARNITSIERVSDCIAINTTDNKRQLITVKNINETWSALQKVFTEGLTS